MLSVAAPYTLSGNFFEWQNEKLHIMGQNLDFSFNNRIGYKASVHFLSFVAKRLSLKLKTGPKELLGFLRLSFTLPGAKVVKYILI
jgi:hypothetical protein